MGSAQTPNIGTPVPSQNASVMAPVGEPKAAHLGAPHGIPAGPSNQELMLQIQQQGNMLAELSAMLMTAKARGFVPEELVDTPPEMRTYYHQTPGSNIVVTRRGPNGEHLPETVHFDHHGEITTDDPVVQQFLDGIADKTGVPIYTKKAPLVDVAAQKAAEEVQAIAARTIEKLGPEAGALKA
jgi:hypothetical protein